MRIRRRITIERIYVYGPMEEQKETLDWCYKNDYRPIEIGPKPIGYRRYDMEKYRIIADKILDKKKG